MKVESDTGGVEPLLLLEEFERRKAQKKLFSYFPETGPLRRSLYPKHMEFMEATAKYRQVAFVAGNRIGKSEMVAFTTAVCGTGLNPPFWTGWKPNKPLRIWIVGVTAILVRDSIQNKLIGPIYDLGTGFIPGTQILRVSRRNGIADTADTAVIQHVSGGFTSITFKSYDQRREVFQSEAVDLVIFDEEPPEDIYEECLARTMTTGGKILCAFTPMLGQSAIVRKYFESEADNELSGRKLIQAGWDDVPHLDEKAKAELYRSFSPHTREARTKGIPTLGSGAIYPLPEDEIFIKPFELPEYWPRVYALDVGWNKTAALWGAWNLDEGSLYCYSEHYQGQAEPSIHAEAIKARGDWIPGVIDPAARGRSQHDGESLQAIYRSLGLTLQFAQNAREAGLYAVWQMLSSGKLKFFDNLTNTREEIRYYHRNDKGEIVKERDHLMDCLRYMVMAGALSARTKSRKTGLMKQFFGRRQNQGWMSH